LPVGTLFAVELFVDTLELRLIDPLRWILLFTGHTEIKRGGLSVVATGHAALVTAAADVPAGLLFTFSGRHDMMVLFGYI
jgi:hypothetical protein